MPLRPGSSREIVAQNIREMVAAGHPHDQAVAAAMASARHHAFGGYVGRYAAGGITDNLFAPPSQNPSLAGGSSSPSSSPSQPLSVSTNGSWGGPGQYNSPFEAAMAGANLNPSQPPLAASTTGDWGGPGQYNSPLDAAMAGVNLQQQPPAASTNWGAPGQFASPFDAAMANTPGAANAPAQPQYNTVGFGGGAYDPGLYTGAISPIPGAAPSATSTSPSMGTDHTEWAVAGGMGNPTSNSPSPSPNPFGQAPVNTGSISGISGLGSPAPSNMGSSGGGGSGRQNEEVRAAGAGIRGRDERGGRRDSDDGGMGTGGGGGVGGSQDLAATLRAQDLALGQAAPTGMAEGGNVNGGLWNGPGSMLTPGFMPQPSQPAQSDSNDGFNPWNPPNGQWGGPVNSPIQAALAAQGYQLPQMGATPQFNTVGFGGGAYDPSFGGMLGGTPPPTAPPPAAPAADPTSAPAPATPQFNTVGFGGGAYDPTFGGLIAGGLGEGHSASLPETTAGGRAEGGGVDNSRRAEAQGGDPGDWANLLPVPTGGGQGRKPGIPFGGLGSSGLSPEYPPLSPSPDYILTLERLHAARKRAQGIGMKRGGPIKHYDDGGDGSGGNSDGQGDAGNADGSFGDGVGGGEDGFGGGIGSGESDGVGTGESSGPSGDVGGGPSSSESAASDFGAFGAAAAAAAADSLGGGQGEGGGPGGGSGGEGSGGSFGAAAAAGEAAAAAGFDAASGAGFGGGFGDSSGGIGGGLGDSGAGAAGGLGGAGGFGGVGGGGLGDSGLGGPSASAASDNAANTAAANAANAFGAFGVNAAQAAMAAANADPGVGTLGGLGNTGALGAQAAAAQAMSAQAQANAQSTLAGLTASANPGKGNDDTKGDTKGGPPATTADPAGKGATLAGLGIDAAQTGINAGQVGITAADIAAAQSAISGLTSTPSAPGFAEGEAKGTNTIGNADVGPSFTGPGDFGGLGNPDNSLANSLSSMEATANYGLDMGLSAMEAANLGAPFTSATTGPEATDFSSQSNPGSMAATGGVGYGQAGVGDQGFGTGTFGGPAASLGESQGNAGWGAGQGGIGNAGYGFGVGDTAGLGGLGLSANTSAFDDAPSNAWDDVFAAPSPAPTNPNDAIAATPTDAQMAAAIATALGVPASLAIAGKAGLENLSNLNWSDLWGLISSPFSKGVDLPSVAWNSKAGVENFGPDLGVTTSRGVDNLATDLGVNPGTAVGGGKGLGAPSVSDIANAAPSTPNMAAVTAGLQGVTNAPTVEAPTQAPTQTVDVEIAPAPAPTPEPEPAPAPAPTDLPAVDVDAKSAPVNAPSAPTDAPAQTGGLGAPGSLGTPGTSGQTGGLSGSPGAPGAPDGSPGGLGAPGAPGAPGGTAGSGSPSDQNAITALNSPDVIGPATSQNRAANISQNLTQARAGSTAALNSNPGLARLTAALAYVEDPKNTQAMLESMMNRAAATGKSISSIVNNRGYYARGISHARANALIRAADRGNPTAKATLDKAMAALAAVERGSNVSNFSTGNASLGVGFGHFGKGMTGTQTAVLGTPGAPEGYGLERGTFDWASRMGFAGAPSQSKSSMMAQRGRGAERGQVGPGAVSETSPGGAGAAMGTTGIAGLPQGVPGNPNATPGSAPTALAETPGLAPAPPTALFDPSQGRATPGLAPAPPAVNRSGKGGKSDPGAVPSVPSAPTAPTGKGTGPQSSIPGLSQVAAALASVLGPSQAQAAPAGKGLTDRGVQANYAKGIVAEAAKGIGPKSTQAEAAAALSKASAAMAKAGVPADIARAALLAGANNVAAAMGYGRGDYGGMVGAAIDRGVASEMQGYHAAAPGPVQGPPSPDDEFDHPVPPADIPAAPGMPVAGPPAMPNVPANQSAPPVNWNTQTMGVNPGVPGLAPGSHPGNPAMANPTAVVVGPEPAPGLAPTDDFSSRFGALATPQQAIDQAFNDLGPTYAPSAQNPTTSGRGLEGPWANVDPAAFDPAFYGPSPGPMAENTPSTAPAEAPAPAAAPGAPAAAPSAPASASPSAPAETAPASPAQAAPVSIAQGLEAAALNAAVDPTVTFGEVVGNIALRQMRLSGIAPKTIAEVAQLPALPIEQAIKTDDITKLMTLLAGAGLDSRQLAEIRPMFNKVADLMSKGVPSFQHAADGGDIKRNRWPHMPQSRNIEDRRGEPPATEEAKPWYWGDVMSRLPASGSGISNYLGLQDIPQTTRVDRAQGGLVNEPGHYAFGGSTMKPQTGMHLIQSATPGRTDRIRMNARPGSFVIPADVVSGVGQGNTTAGAKMWGDIIKAGPYGQKMKPMAAGHMPKMGSMKPPSMGAMPHLDKMSAPHLPASPKAAAPAPIAGLGGASAATGMDSAGRSGKQERFLHAMADGGMLQDDGGLTPIVVAGGEAILDPEVVAAYGNGDMEVGKKILSDAIQHMRKQIVAHTAKLPGPIA